MSSEITNIPYCIYSLTNMGWYVPTMNKLLNLFIQTLFCNFVLLPKLDFIHLRCITQRLCQAL